MSNDNHEINHLLHQVKSEARKDCVKQFFIKNAKVLGIAAAVAIVALIIFFVVDVYNKSQQEKFSEIFHQSLIDQQLGDLPKAKESLVKIYEAKSAPNGVKSLASLRYAAILLDENNKAEAVKVYQNIAACGGCDPYIKDLASLLAIKVWISDENEIKKDDLIARIEKIEAKSKILRYYISEQKGLLQIEKNNLEKAYAIFEEISKNPETPKNLKTRAGDALKLIVSKGFEVKKAVVVDSKK